jgi:hypothetical protein
VPGVVEPGLRARDRERLAGAAAGPDRAARIPASKFEGVGPTADPGEEVALGEASEVIGGHVDNRATVDHPGGQDSSATELLEPAGGEVVDLVVVDTAVASVTDHIHGR